MNGARERGEEGRQVNHKESRFFLFFFFHYENEMLATVATSQHSTLLVQMPQFVRIP